MHPIKTNVPIYNVGFTLVELLIVVIIVSTLASILIPGFSGVVNSSSSGAELQNTKILQDAIDRYRADHEFYPSPASRSKGCAGLSSEWHNLSETDGLFLRNRLVLYTDSEGVVCDARKDSKEQEFPLGPYIKKRIPINPVNGSRRVYVSAKLPDSGANLQSYGWVYSYETGTLRAATDWQ